MKSTESITLKSTVSKLKGIGPKKAESLQRLGIYSLEDALYFYPRSYNDYRNPKKISECVNDEKVLIIAKVLLVNKGYGYGRKRTLHVFVEDKSGRMEVLFFMAGYMQNSFKIGEEYCFIGRVKVENARVTMFHPDFTLYDSCNLGIVPVYPLTKGVTQKDIKKITSEALAHCNELDETLPRKVVENASLCSNTFALNNIHFPNNEDEFKKSKYRLVYEELFDLKTALALSKGRGGKSAGLRIKSGKAAEFIASLPFELTNAQKRVLSEIVSDMNSEKSMNRLVQGDVGSGKTIVAAAALVEACFAGFQGLFMAPTDILAVQHYNNLRALFEPFGIKTVLLTSSIGTKERNKILGELADGSVQVAIGTHALISEGVKYKNVGLVITDEQHRFGVSQRERLSAKGEKPDILVMTATPIPRTLAVVLFADLDISVIDELPPGREKIETRQYTEKTRVDAYKLLFSELEKGHQAYVVAPFIEDSETINGRSAERLFEAFQKKHPKIPSALLHGELKQYEKDDVMGRFYKGEIKVLFSTVVIEVGIDVPNATVMLIENSERFGLAQMHQLRGRVGRGKDKSFCLICIGDASEIANQRADILCSSSDGFFIAEKDLEIRGPGEFFGYRQHGLPQLNLADPIKHAGIAELASKDAQGFLLDDPTLEKEDNKAFKNKIEKKFMQLDNLTI